MQLITAVANRDAELLRPLVDDNILLDFGGGSGWEEMLGRLDQDENSLWTDLDEVVRLGCAPDGDDRISMPYYWTQSFDGLDPYGTYIITGDNVPFYTARAGQETIRRLNWEAVELIAYFERTSEDAESQRVEIRARDGRRGFVDRNSLRALIDYRLLAVRKGDRWVITVFVAGD